MSLIGSKYVTENTLGQGTFGQVILARDIETSRRVAIKVCSRAGGTMAQNLVQEIETLSKLRHMNIVQLFEVFEDEKNVYIVLEYIPGGELFDYIAAHNRVREKESRDFFAQIAAAVQYVHSLNIVHRDLKPENILLDLSHTVKIIDFGLAYYMGPNDHITGRCGSPHYTSPEMLKGEAYGPPVDMWSSGVILFALLCGYLPFDDSSRDTLVDSIKNGRYYLPKWLSPNARDLLKRLLTVDPAKRITADETLRHPWLLEESGPPIELCDLVTILDMEETAITEKESRQSQVKSHYGSMFGSTATASSDQHATQSPLVITLDDKDEASPIVNVLNMNMNAPIPFVTTTEPIVQSQAGMGANAGGSGASVQSVSVNIDEASECMPRWQLAKERRIVDNLIRKKSIIDMDLRAMGHNPGVPVADGGKGSGKTRRRASSVNFGLSSRLSRGMSANVSMNINMMNMNMNGVPQGPGTAGIGTGTGSSTPTASASINSMGGIGGGGGGGAGIVYQQIPPTATGFLSTPPGSVITVPLQPLQSQRGHGGAEMDVMSVGSAVGGKTSSTIVPLPPLAEVDEEAEAAAGAGSKQQQQQHQFSLYNPNPSPSHKRRHTGMTEAMEDVSIERLESRRKSRTNSEHIQQQTQQQHGPVRRSRSRLARRMSETSLVYPAQQHTYHSPIIQPPEATATASLSSTASASAFVMGVTPGVGPTYAVSPTLSRHAQSQSQSQSQRYNQSQMPNQRAPSYTTLPFPESAVTNLQPPEIMASMKEILEQLQMESVEWVGPFSVVAATATDPVTETAVELQISVYRLSNLAGMHVIVGHRRRGDVWLYCALFQSIMDLFSKKK